MSATARNHVDFSHSILSKRPLNGGALILSGNTTIENASGTGPGAITLNGSVLEFEENYTFDKLTLNGGVVTGHGSIATVERGGMVQGYGGFFWETGSLVLHNDGTINANVKGQWLSIYEMPFVNDGLVLASGGGNILIDYFDPSEDPWSNAANGIISVINGGTLQLGSRFTNFGLITAVNSTVDFSDGTVRVQNDGKIHIFGGTLIFGSIIGNDTAPWTDAGLITTVSSLLKNPRHGESVVIQFSVTNRRRLACGAHL